MRNTKKTGNWSRVDKIVRNLDTTFKKTADIHLRKIGLKAEGMAKMHISKQDLGWEPLSASYQKKKIREGLSNLVLVASSTYFQNITSWKMPNKSFAGVKRGVAHKNGEYVYNIGRILEFGSTSAKIPARPLWREVKKEIGRDRFLGKEAQRIFKIEMIKRG